MHPNFWLVFWQKQNQRVLFELRKMSIELERKDIECPDDVKLLYIIDTGLFF